MLRGGVPLVACFHWILQLQRHLLLDNAERALEFAARGERQFSGRPVSIFSRWIAFITRSPSLQSFKRPRRRDGRRLHEENLICTPGVISAVGGELPGDLRA